MEKNSFILYTNILPRVERLSREQAGELFVAVLQYASTGEIQEYDDPVLDIMYGFITEQIARDKEKFLAICQRRSENAKKRWAKQMHTATGENETETVNVNENDTDTVSVTVTETELPPAAQAAAPAVQEDTTTTTQPPQTKEEQIREMLGDTETPSVIAIIAVAGILGYNWSGQEAQRFLDYNKTKNRKDNWEYAVRRWEEQRSRHKKSPADLTDKEREEMEAYLSLSKIPPRTGA